MKNSKEKMNKLIKVALFCIACVIISRLILFAIYFKDTKDLSIKNYIEAFNKWDSGWFEKTINYGYDDEPTSHEEHDAANWAFFPLMPIVCRAMVKIFNQPSSVIGPILNTIFFIIALIIAWYYLEETRGKKNACLYVFLATFGMYTFYFSSTYTESLYLLCLVRFFLCDEKRKIYINGNNGSIGKCNEKYWNNACLCYNTIYNS